MRRLVFFIIFWGGCASLVKPLENPEINPRGMPAVISLVKGGKVVAEELITADSENLWIIKQGEKTAIPMKDISKITVFIYDREDVGNFWFIYTLLMGITSPCAAPFICLIGSIGCALDEAYFKYQRFTTSNPIQDLKTLRAYSRYPQGMPRHTYKWKISTFKAGSESNYEVRLEGKKLVININEGRQTVEYYIVSPSGGLLKRRKLGVLRKGKYTYKLDLKNLKKGRYILKIKIGNKIKEYEINIEE